MKKAIVITPVKNALNSSLVTIEKITSCPIEIEYIVYDDFSNEETTHVLEQKSTLLNFNLQKLSELTDTPSPNYNIVLADAQKRALNQNLPLIVVESDVEIAPDTFEKLLAFADRYPDAGMIGAVTVNQQGEINFPYLKFKNQKNKFLSTTRSLSFCCTLLSVPFLKSYNFSQLDRKKDWYDTIISKKSIALHFSNYILFDTPVLHKAHGSRPWKQLKYDNPLKYYWLKLINRRDKI